MVWRWRDPKGQSGPVCILRDQARADAVRTARLRAGVVNPRVLDRDLEDRLWRWLEQAGWTLGEIDL